MTAERKPDGSIRIHGVWVPVIISIVATIIIPSLAAYISVRVTSARAEERIASVDKSLVDAVKVNDEKFDRGIAGLKERIGLEAEHTRAITAFQFAAINHRLESFELRIKTLEGTSAPTYSVQPRKQP